MKISTCITTGLLSYIAITQGAQAAVFTWDPDSVTAGNQGSGNWNTTDAEWYVTAGTYVGWTNSSSNTAFFNAATSGAAQTATVTADITVGNISSQNGANIITLNPATTLSLAANGTNSNSIAVANNSFQINGTGTVLLTASSNWNAFGGALTIASGVTVDLGANTLSIVGTNSHTLNGVISGTGGGLTKINAGAFTVTNTNTYTGATTIGTAGSSTSAGVMTVSGAAGSIANSASYTVSGSGSQLNLDYSGGAGPATLDRLNNSSGAALTLNNGGEVRFTNATNATNTSETFGTLTLDTGAGIVTVNQAGTGGAVNTITASAFSRGSNFGTGLIRASGLGVTTNTNRGQVKLTSTAGLTQIGSSTSATGLGSGILKDLTIVSYLIGDTSTGDTGDNFVTYDTTSGFRILGTSEQVLLATGTYTPVGNPENVKLSTSTVTLANASGITVNSLALLGGANTLNSTNAIALTVNSGAVGQFVSGVTATIGSGFSQLKLDNSEGVITVLGTGILDIATPIDVTSGGTHAGSGALTKAGAGTLRLSGSNLFTGVTTINQGTLQIGNGTSGNLAAGSGAITSLGGTTLSINMGAGATLANDIVANGNAVQKIIGTNTNTLSGNISGSAGVLMNIAGGTLSFSGTNSFAGATSVTAGVLNIRNNTALGTTAGGTTVTAGAALQIQNDITVGAEALALNGTGISNDGALRNISDTNIYGGVVTLGSNSRINSDAGSLTLSGGVAGNTRNLTVGGSGDTSISTITTTTGTLTKDGGGTLTLSGASTFSGGTTVSGGTLLANNTGVTSATGTGAISVLTTSTLGGTGRIAPTASGTAGISVASGGHLAPGAGIESLDIALGATTGVLTMVSGSDFQFELGTANAAITTITLNSSDLLFISGVSTTTGDVVFNSNNVDFLGTGQVGFYKLFDTDRVNATLAGDTWANLTYDPTTGLVSSGLNATGLAGTLTGTFIMGGLSSGGDAGDIYLQVVPEPAAAMLGGIGMLALLRRRRDC